MWGHAAARAPCPVSPTLAQALGRSKEPEMRRSSCGRSAGSAAMEHWDVNHGWKGSTTAFIEHFRAMYSLNNKGFVPLIHY